MRLADLFPDGAPLVPATWVTGVLTVATGGLLVYVHAGFGSLYGAYRLVNLVNGRVRQVRDLSARQWAERAGRILPDDWFAEEPDDIVPLRRPAAEFCKTLDGSERRRDYERAQEEAMTRLRGIAPDPRRPLARVA